MLFVDRIENNVVVCYDINDNKIDLDKTLLPPSVREGDVIRNDSGFYYIDKEETEKRRKIVSDLQNNLWQ